MSMQLYIIYGSTTLDFQANGYKLKDGFFPETPDEGVESISDQFDILIRGSSGSDLRSKINAIRLAFEHAKLHKDDAQAAWLYFDVDSSGDAWMSKIVKGLIMYDRNLDRNWRQNKIIVTVIIEHKPYWDAKNEVQVPLTNGNGTDILTGLTVYNHNDSDVGPAHDNWIDIAAADVSGDKPGRMRLEVLNSYATNRLNTLWIGHNITDPDNLVHIIEGESSTTGTQLGDSGCSNAYYRQYALPSGSEYSMFTWTLADTFLNACKGQYYKIMVRFFSTVPTNVKFRIKLIYEATTIWQSGQVSLDATRAYLIRDLFTLRLPPWLLGLTDLNALTMVMTGQQSSGSSVNVNIDFLQVTPLDTWRMLECTGYGVSQNERLIDDGLNEVAYIDNGSGDNKLGIIVGYGNPIALYPGKKQRLYFLMHSNIANAAEILRTISVKIYYHPRRETL